MLARKSHTSFHDRPSHLWSPGDGPTYEQLVNKPHEDESSEYGFVAEFAKAALTLEKTKYQEKVKTHDDARA